MKACRTDNECTSIKIYLETYSRASGSLENFNLEKYLDYRNADSQKRITFDLTQESLNNCQNLKINVILRMTITYYKFYDLKIVLLLFTYQSVTFIFHITVIPDKILYL